MWIAILIAVIVLIILLLPLVRTTPGRNELKNMEIADVDFKKLRDGTYEGKYRGIHDNLRDVAVEVKIVSGVLTKIKIKRDGLNKKKRRADPKFAEAVNTMFDAVLKAQSLQVDTVSGATLTCKANLKAVEYALEKAKAKED